MLKGMRKTTLAVAVAGALAVGVSASASAYVDSGSALVINNLVITSGAIGGNFTFTEQNIATLNGAAAPVGFATCSNITCPAFPVNPTLDAPSASLGPAPVGYTLVGPIIATEWSKADSIIDSAEAVGAPSTNTRQVAESVLQGGTDASASAQIQSITTLIFSFVLTGDTLSLAFDADPNMYAAVDQPFAGLFNAQSNLNTSFTLSRDGSGGQINWTPQGPTSGNDCTNTMGFGTCTESADTQDLNLNVGTSTNGTIATHSTAAGLTAFGIDLTGLLDGTYTLTLNAVTSTQLSQLRFAPEPGTILLLGAGLAALGLGSRRRKAIA